MTFTRISKGRYHFKGIDSWNGKEIEGEIVHQPYDVKLSEQWQVIFGDYTAYLGATLRDCKQWLIK